MATCSWCEAAPATLQMVELVSGNRRMVQICTACAMRMGRGEGRLREWLTKCGSPTPPGVTAAAEGVCPGCGLTAARWREEGRLGCAECYDAFADLLATAIPSLTVGEAPTAKEPRSVPPTSGSQATAAAAADRQDALLQRELDEAVEREDFERAATLRDALAQRRSGNARGSLT